MATKIGYHAYPDRHNPWEVVEHIILAEKYGFETIWVADHFQPWWHKNAHCSFAWTLLATALERTRKVIIGTGVTAPILRYNPAIIAQAFATLGYMYPGRVFLGLGTGEPMNEYVIGYEWPNAKERLNRFEEALQVIKRLWNEEFVNFNGRYYKLRNANLYTKPPVPIPIYVASHIPASAEIAGRYADGILIYSAFPEYYYQKVLLPAADEGARKEGRPSNSLEKVIELVVSYDEDLDKALNSARVLAGSLVMKELLKLCVYDPRLIEEYAMRVPDETIMKTWIVSSDIEEHLNRILFFKKMGFSHLTFSSLSPNEKKFLEIYSKDILPVLREDDST